MKPGFVYIITNKSNTVLYTGVTSDLKGRIAKHKNKTYKNSFAARYNCEKLVYYKEFETISLAIEEEKRIKGGSRKRKEDLINSVNKAWEDLYDRL